MCTHPSRQGPPAAAAATPARKAFPCSTSSTCSSQPMRHPSHGVLPSATRTSAAPAAAATGTTAAASSKARGCSQQGPVLTSMRFSGSSCCSGRKWEADMTGGRLPLAASSSSARKGQGQSEQHASAVLGGAGVGSEQQEVGTRTDRRGPATRCFLVLCRTTKCRQGDTCAPSLPPTVGHGIAAAGAPPF